MDVAEIWRKFFAQWPTKLPQRGVAIASTSEQIPFEGFLLGESLIMLRRRAPDSVGGRIVLVPYGRIEAVKVVDPVKDDVFVSGGFRDTAKVAQKR